MDFLPGDHIKVSYWIFNHHAIFVEWSPGKKGQATVIHYRAGKSGTWIGSCICEEDEDVSQYVLVERPRDGKAVLDRARTRLGETKYWLFFSNCENFCDECLAGGGVSWQIVLHIQTVVRTAQTTVVALAGHTLIAAAIGLGFFTGILVLGSHITREANRWQKKQITWRTFARNSIAHLGAHVGGWSCSWLFGLPFAHVCAGPFVPLAILCGFAGSLLGIHYCGWGTRSLLDHFLPDDHHEVELGNAYTFLEIPPTASIEEARRAYLTLALRFHPDKPGGSHEMMIKLRESFDLVQADQMPSANFFVSVVCCFAKLAHRLFYQSCPALCPTS
mmetsp:Transcript_34162/g.72685  ORF Transcript_34162/g.72685 Transcript_34162/m.72685 type:complete len:332 (+) Transcript_34162:135-1130(+)